MTLRQYIRTMMVVFAGLLIVSIVIGYMLISSRFDDFVARERQEKIEEFIDLATDLLDEDNFAADKLATLRSYARRQDFSLRIVDQAGRQFNIGKRLPREPLRESVRREITTSAGRYQLFLLAPNRRVSAGTLALRHAVQTIVIVAAGVAVLGVILLSRAMSRKISQPLQAASARANQVATGQWTATTVNDSSNIVELDQLHQSLEQMAASIMAQAAIRKRFTEQMGHEIKTPLAIIKGKLEAMQDGVIVASNTEIEALHREIIELTHLVEGIEDVQALTSNYETTTMQAVALHPLIDELLSRIDYSYKKRQLTLHAQLANATVLTDPVKLKSLLLNVLSNAGKYAITGSTIDLTVDVNRGETCISLKNRRHTAVAIQVEQLTEAGYRGGMTEIEGKGLGLFIAKDMARHIGARLAFVVGEDSFLVQVFLPLAAANRVPDTRV